MPRVNHEGEAPFIDTRSLTEDEERDLLDAPSPARPLVVAVVLAAMIATAVLIGMDPLGIIFEGGAK